LKNIDSGLSIDGLSIDAEIDLKEEKKRKIDGKNEKNGKGGVR